MQFRRRRFGDPASATPFRSREVWGMVVADLLYEKSVFFEILQWLNYKGCLLDKHFRCISEGRYGFSFAGSLEEFSATVTMCGRKCGL